MAKLFNVEAMTTLRNFIRDKVTDEQFKMDHGRVEYRCGTVGCIAGWGSVCFNQPIEYLFDVSDDPDRVVYAWQEVSGFVADKLGFNDGVYVDLERRLFLPPGYGKFSGHYTREHVLRVLTEMIETGQGPRWNPLPEYQCP